MFCPFCSQETKVLESRLVEKGVRRRRECLKCNNRFTTYEKAIFNFMVTKKDGREEPFNLGKISNSVRLACNKINQDDLLKITQKIEQRILLKKRNPLPTSQIGKIVLAELKKYNKIAYLRFASVHKAIDDPRMLKKELTQII